VKHRTIFVPMLMPKLSDQAATHLVDILEQLLGIAQHHYGDQVHRCRRRQINLAISRRPNATSNIDDPF
jgi:hypothetical protein